LQAGVNHETQEKHEMNQRIDSPEWAAELQIEQEATDKTEK
jgi:hypothetical protein